MFLAAVQIPKSLYSPGGHYMHVVSPTDTLAGVALAYNMRVDELKRLNRLYGSTTVFPGQRLRVRANNSSKQCIDSMNTSASKSTKSYTIDKFRKEMNEDRDLKTSNGAKKKKRSIKNRHDDMLAPVDIIQAADHVAGPENEDSKLGTDAISANKPTGIKGEDITKKLGKKYKLFKKRINIKKNVTTTKVLEDGAPSPAFEMNRSTDKKSKNKLKKSKAKAKKEVKSNVDLANLTITQKEVFKTRAQLVYHTNEVYVPGEVTIAMGNISFEPDLDNSYVQKFGCALLTVSFALEDVIKCEEISDDMRMDYDKDTERLLSIELKPLEGQLMMQTRTSLEFLIPVDKITECLTLLRGPVNEHAIQEQNSLNDSLVRSSESLARSFMSPTALPILKQESTIISLENARKLARFFPNRHRCDDWVQLYTSTIHGFSWRTLYAKIKKAVPTILIFKDRNGYTFGAFVAHQWQKGPNFYGNGETFLFSLVPHFGVYKWTEKNSFFVTSSDSHFAFGGCEFGLYLDDELCSGCSYRSDTYFNRCLASEEEFQCVAVEAWTLQSK